MFELQPLGVIRKKFWKQIRPLTDDDGIVLKVFIPAEIDEFVGRFQPIEIKVMDRGIAIFVGIDDAEGWAGDAGLRL